MWEKSMIEVLNGGNIYTSVNYSKKAFARHQKDIADIYKCLAMVKDDDFWKKIIELERGR